MKEKFLNSSINFINSNGKYSEQDIKKLRYGLEGIYLTITKMIFIILLALILGILKEVIIVIVLFNFLRYFGFGFHAEKSYQCLILSTIWFVILPFIFLKFTISTNIFLFVSALCIFNILLFAPADTIKRPLRNKKKRIIRKILNLLLASIFVILGIIFNNSYIYSLILASLIIEVIVIAPTTYRLFKQPYNNYKNCDYK